MMMMTRRKVISDGDDDDDDDDSDDDDDDDNAYSHLTLYSKIQRSKNHKYDFLIQATTSQFYYHLKSLSRQKILVR